MRVVVNGEAREIDGRPSLADAAALVGVSASDPGVAAAVDGMIVPRAQWASTLLGEDVRVEVVRAAAGG